MKTSNNKQQKPLQLCEQTGKVVFASRDLAVASMQYLNRFRPKKGTGGRLLNAYKCDHCKGWHLTSHVERKL